MNLVSFDASFSSYKTLFCYIGQSHYNKLATRVDYDFN